MRTCDIDTGIKESTLWTVRDSATKIKVYDWIILKCYEINKKMHKEIEEKEKIWSIFIKDQRVKKSGTTVFTWTFISKHLKWKALYPAELASLSASRDCCSNFKQCYKSLSYQLLHMES